jgi:hypothetical protein
MKIKSSEIRRLERKVFPHLKFEDGNYCHNPKDTEPSWVFFSPHFYAKNPAIITSDLVDRMQNGAKLLSVGSGPAYLEQFLVLAYNIPKQNVTLSDRDNKHVPKDYNFVSFDIKNSWPWIGKGFDYIIFPESLFFGTDVDGISSYRFREKVELFNHILDECSKVLNNNGEIRMKGTIPLQNIVDRVMDDQKSYRIIQRVYIPAFESYMQLKKV